MPAPKWPPPLRLLKNGRLRVRYKGRDYYISGSDPDDPEVRTAYARLLAELAAGVRDSPRRS